MTERHESDAVTDDSVTPERFGQIRAVFEAALDQPEAERDADVASVLGHSAPEIRQLTYICLADTSRCMRTTVRIDDVLLRRAKKRAADEGRTLTSLIEEGLKIVTAKPRSGPKKTVKLPVSRAKGGTLPGVDLNRWTDLEDVMSSG